MLSKTLRGTIRLPPHESGRVRRGSLKEAAAGGLTPGERQNLQHDIGDHAVHLRHPEQPPRQGVLKPRNSSPEISPPQGVRDFPQSDRAALLREFREWRSRRASVQLPPLHRRCLRRLRALPNPSAFECRWRRASCLRSVCGCADASLRIDLNYDERSYFGVNSRFTASLTCFPSTLIPAAAKRAMTFFITVPMSFMVGEPISPITALTPATISSSPAALGR